MTLFSLEAGPEYCMAGKTYGDSSKNEEVRVVHTNTSAAKPEASQKTLLMHM